MATTTIPATTTTQPGMTVEQVGAWLPYINLAERARMDFRVTKTYEDDYASMAKVCRKNRPLLQAEFDKAIPSLSIGHPLRTLFERWHQELLEALILCSIDTFSASVEAQGQFRTAEIAEFEAAAQMAK